MGNFQFTVGGVYFAVFAVIALIGALATVASKNPIRSAVGLLTTILGVAGLYLQLHAQFLAAIQLIVYAGAVVILFVFVIMVLGPDAQESQDQAKGELARLGSAGLFAILAAVALWMLGKGSVSGEPTPLNAVRETHGSVEAVGGLLFSKGLVPFELATALLVVAVVGAIAVARGKAVRKEKPRALPPGKFYAGPVHPRDAGRPLSEEEGSR